MPRLDLELGQRSYGIHVGSGLLSGLLRWTELVRGRDAVIVTNQVVGPLYADALAALLSGKRVHRVLLPDGEEQKNWANLERIILALAEAGAQRDACVFALGGGVIGDLAGLAAALWMRGIDLVQVPTTLLAMVDSSVGGKTAINLAQGKNLVGAFWQPKAVIADLDTLATLPEREYRAGLAEVVKYGAIRDAEFFHWLEHQAEALLDRDPLALTEAVLRSCRHKAEVVARDEREEGERALLNFGHTFGHALEAEAQYGVLLHGEAVAIGMVAAARSSATLGLANEQDGERLSALLTRLGLPTRIPADLDAERLLARMQLDKKARAGALRLVLWRGIGRAELQVVDPAPLRAILTAAGERV